MLERLYIILTVSMLGLVLCVAVGCAIIAASAFIALCYATAVVFPLIPLI